MISLIFLNIKYDMYQLASSSSGHYFLLWLSQHQFTAELVSLQKACLVFSATRNSLIAAIISEAVSLKDQTTRKFLSQLPKSNARKTFSAYFKLSAQIEAP